jgi:hypothetical protein
MASPHSKAATMERIRFQAATVRYLCVWRRAFVLLLVWQLSTDKKSNEQRTHGSAPSSGCPSSVALSVPVGKQALQRDLSGSDIMVFDDTTYCSTRPVKPDIVSVCLSCSSLRPRDHHLISLTSTFMLLVHLII